MPRREERSSSHEENGQPEMLVLAAIDRAVRHRPGRSGAPFWTLLDHLGLARRSSAARRLRPRLGEMESADLIAQSTEHGVPLWRLTAKGARRLASAARSAEPPRLGESPQHAAWRRARTLAEQELDRFREQLRTDLESGLELLADEDDALDSDALLLLAEVLRDDARRLGSAWYCRYEWAEPDDHSADVDEGSSPEGNESDPQMRALRSGRRNVRLWEEPR